MFCCTSAACKSFYDFSVHREQMSRVKMCVGLRPCSMCGGKKEILKGATEGMPMRHQGAPTRSWGSWSASGVHFLVYKAICSKKISRGLSKRSTVVSWRNLGRDTFDLQSDSAGETFIYVFTKLSSTSSPAPFHLKP